MSSQIERLRALNASAAKVEPTFKLANGIYVVGCLERKGTVYSQQVRVHNLVWSIWELLGRPQRQSARIAVVGGGIAGLTAVACLKSLFGSAEITLLEKRLDFCTDQLGADTRWLHPRIYDWPDLGSRMPNATLPMLNWREGRASDVARQILQKFHSAFLNQGENLKIYAGIKSLTISHLTKQIVWSGREASLAEGFVGLGNEATKSDEFDYIILTPGFGSEEGFEGRDPIPYWRNDQLGQTALNDQRQTYVVSGYGDGAIVDLCRLTIARFRQDTILDEIFGDKLEDVESRLRTFLGSVSPIDYTALGKLHPLLLPLDDLRPRIRKDTRVIMHLVGRAGNRSIADVFNRAKAGAFLNRYLLYLLYRCCAFETSFDSLTDTIKGYGVPSENVRFRHGANTMNYLRTILVPDSEIDDMLSKMAERQAQVAARRWDAGCFPPLEMGERA